MIYVYCPNCGKKTGHKRVLGIGTILGGVATWGVSLNAIPFYPKRCIVCGMKSSGEQAPPTPQPKPQYSGSYETPATILPHDSVLQEKNIKKCPDCAEEIKLEAINLEKENKMKKIIMFVIMILSMSVFAYGEGPCGSYEYAELQDMDQKTLFDLYYKIRPMGVNLGAAWAFGGRGKIEMDYYSCKETMTKMERVYKKRFDKNIDDDYNQKKREEILKEEPKERTFPGGVLQK